MTGERPCSHCGYSFSREPLVPCRCGLMEEGDYMPAFYADPVDADGNVVGTATWEITHSSGWPLPLKAVKVPHSEIVIDDDTPTIRVREEDFPS